MRIAVRQESQSAEELQIVFVFPAWTCTELWQKTTQGTWSLPGAFSRTSPHRGQLRSATYLVRRIPLQLDMYLSRKQSNGIGYFRCWPAYSRLRKFQIRLPAPKCHLGFVYQNFLQRWANRLRMRRLAEFHGGTHPRSSAFQSGHMSCLQTAAAKSLAHTRS